MAQTKAGERIAAPERRTSSPARTGGDAPGRSADATLGSHDRVGNGAIGRWIQRGVRRGDLRVSEPADPHEREAHHVAGQLTASRPVFRPRVPAPGREGARTPPGDRLVHGLGPGDALGPLLRERFEGSLGHDLSGVRIHTSPAASDAAAAVHAQAFTVGSHIAFARDRWSPDTAAGQRLLAHEIVHAAQHQSDGVLLHRQDEPESGPTSQASEVEQHMRRQYERLSDLLSFDDWNSLLTAAEHRAAKQAVKGSTGDWSAFSIKVPLDTLLDPRARYVDVDMWDQLFNLLYAGDQGPTAGILIRNEIARQWFTRNAVNPKQDQVTVSLIDPEGLQDGPAQLDFVWRTHSIMDTFGAIELEWLDQPLRSGLMVQPLRDAAAEVSYDARKIADAAALKRDKEALEPKLPPIIKQAQDDLAKATLAEIEAYQHLVTEDAELAHQVRDRSPRADAFIPGVAEYFDQTNRVLFQLLKDVRDWRVGKSVVTNPDDYEPRVQQRTPSEREVRVRLGDPYPSSDLHSYHSGYGPTELEKLYAAGQISFSGAEELDAAMRDRAIITGLVMVAITFATLGSALPVAESIGLAEGTLTATALDVGATGAVTGLVTTATQDIVTRAIHLDDPRAQQLWEASGPTLTTYLTSVGLGFLMGAGLVAVFGGAMAAWNALKSWRAGAAVIEEPLMTTLSDTFNPATNIRTVHMRAADGELFTVATNPENTGYIWSSAAGEMRRIDNGVVGGKVLMLTAGSEHGEMLEELEQMLTLGPHDIIPDIERTEQALDRVRTGQANVGDLEIAFDEIVADFRAFRMASRPAGMGDVLDYRVLLGQCGEGRDISTASLAMLTGRTGQTVRVWRFQALELFDNIGEKHAFAVIEFNFMPGRRFLIDPTFAQFFRPTQFGTGGSFILPPRFIGPTAPPEFVGGGEGLFTGNVLKADVAGTRFARDLVRDGFIELTDANARQYVRGLGIPDAQIDEMSGRLFNVERAQLQEVIGPGPTGVVTHVPATVGASGIVRPEGPAMLDMNGVNSELNRVVTTLEQPGANVTAAHMAQLPRLRALQQRVNQFMANEDNFLLWNQATHSPDWAPLPDEEP